MKQVLSILTTAILMWTVSDSSSAEHLQSHSRETGPPSARLAPRAFSGSTYISGYVGLASLTSSYSGDVVELRWKTSHEMGNRGFEILRSVDLPSWESVGYVRGRGEARSPQEYYFVDFLSDEALGHPTLHYRLRQIDEDGEDRFSPVVSVQTRFASGTAQLFQNYPNPFNPDTKINFSLPDRQHVSLIIYDLLGNEMQRVLDKTLFEEGFHSVSFSGGSLPDGMFIYTLVTQTGRYSRTMEILR